MQAAAVVVLAMALLGCMAVKRPHATGEEKRSFLFASVAAQAANGPKNCRLYANGLSARLRQSPYRYDVQPLYYCSLGTECHVLLRVNTGAAQFVADNGSFIRGHVQSLSEFQHRMSRRGSWRQVTTADAQVMLLAERYGNR